MGVQVPREAWRPEAAPRSFPEENPRARGALLQHRAAPAGAELAPRKSSRSELRSYTLRQTCRSGSNPRSILREKHRARGALLQYEELLQGLSQAPNKAIQVGSVSDCIQEQLAEICGRRAGVGGCLRCRMLRWAETGFLVRTDTPDRLLSGAGCSTVILTYIIKLSDYV
jgi:hypothetical protein